MIAIRLVEHDLNAVIHAKAVGLFQNSLGDQGQHFDALQTKETPAHTGLDRLIADSMYLELFDKPRMIQA